MPEEALPGAWEADQFQRMAGWGGHAGPKSSWPYINQVEAPMCTVTRCARPAAWAEPLSLEARAWFIELTDILPLNTTEAKRVEDLTRAPLSSCAVTIQQRLELTLGVAKGMKLVVAAARAWLDAPLATEVLLQVADALRLNRLVASEDRSPSGTITVLTAYNAWALEAENSKFVWFVEALQARASARDLDKLYSIWSAWRGIRKGECLSVDDAWAGRQFLDHLLELGAERACFVVKSREGAPHLGRQVTDLNLATMQLKARKEPVQHRLQIIDRDVVADEASGRQVSTVGLHWLMVLTASWLIAQGRLKWMTTI